MSQESSCDHTFFEVSPPGLHAFAANFSAWAKDILVQKRPASRNGKTAKRSTLRAVAYYKN